MSETSTANHWSYTMRDHRCEVCRNETTSHLCEGRRVVKSHNDLAGRYCDGSRRVLTDTEELKTIGDK